jgi:hypothetical protein
VPEPLTRSEADVKGALVTALQLILSLGSAFISAVSVFIASVALGARWEGRTESDRRLTEAKLRQLEVARDPNVVEAAVHRAFLEAYRSEDTPVRKALQEAEQVVSRAENEVAARKLRNKGHHEKAGDFERHVDELLRLNQPKGFRGAFERARHGATRTFRRQPPSGSARGVRGART